MAQEQQPVEKKRKLVGYANFKRNNPKSDRFEMKKFHHIEFYCQDATNTAKRFSWGLGMKLVGKSDQSTGNHYYASYALRSGEVEFHFTAPYSKSTEKNETQLPHPGYDIVRINNPHLTNSVDTCRVGFRTSIQY